MATTALYKNQSVNAVIALCSQIHTKQIQCGQNTELRMLYLMVHKLTTGL